MEQNIQSIADLSNTVFIYGFLIGSIATIFILLVFESIKASGIGKPQKPAHRAPAAKPAARPAAKKGKRK